MDNKLNEIMAKAGIASLDEFKKLTETLTSDTFNKMSLQELSQIPPATFLALPTKEKKRLSPDVLLALSETQLLHLPLSSITAFLSLDTLNALAEKYQQTDLQERLDYVKKTQELQVKEESLSQIVADALNKEREFVLTNQLSSKALRNAFDLSSLTLQNLEKSGEIEIVSNQRDVYDYQSILNYLNRCLVRAVYDQRGPLTTLPSLYSLDKASAKTGLSKSQLFKRYTDGHLTHYVICSSTRVCIDDIYLCELYKVQHGMRRN